MLHIADIFSWNIIGNTNISINPNVLSKFNLTEERCNVLLEEIKLIV
ncbi:hypothetical protein SDC9_194730 [bioreactor metagenome]|uniref:Uncharacterized protein n=1 Tax=bioreactor metagenome TaxID=1076179 RepID=A0A645I7N5_9ZZZZ